MTSPAAGTTTPRGGKGGGEGESRDRPHPAPRAMANACSTTGRVWRARQTMAASPPVVRMARPNAVKLIGDARSPWTAAKSVEAASQKKATKGSSLIREPEEPTHETCRPPLADRQQRKERAPCNQRDGQQVSDRQGPSSRQVASPDLIRAKSRPP